jgi:hypothetical protein
LIQFDRPSLVLQYRSLLRVGGKRMGYKYRTQKQQRPTDASGGALFRVVSCIRLLADTLFSLAVKQHRAIKREGNADTDAFA